MFIQEIAKYQDEINASLDNSWQGISNNNKVNKRQQLIDADKKFTEAKLEFIKTIRDSVKFTIRGTHFDLLDGYDDITDDDNEVKLFKLENLFYTNLHSILKAGISFKEILKSSGIVINCFGGFDEILKQKTAVVDSKLNLDSLTAYDKFVYFMSIAGISANDFNYYIKDKIESDSKDTN
jgi:hypothetical protein